MLDNAKQIFFNTLMVRAILDGKKINTRRIIKKKYCNSDIAWFENKYGKRLVYTQNDVAEPRKNSDGTTTYNLIAMEEIKEPYKIGQILYVRETWCDRWLPDGYLEGNLRYGYKADCIEKNYTEGYWGDGEKGKLGVWRPSIHMPKKASRITLKVLGITPQRLNDITENQAIKEGFEPCYYSSIANIPQENAVDFFKSLWNSTIQKKDLHIYGWTANPWVWDINFEVVEIK
ncbi:hypothetical protein [uncultured Clostridium sp.]|uniref:hypothetical protein n=1 Tax=uncultured Clostridium sp. TaxID=59620 RepID=UPI0028E9C760|nr:hypothetical protein [uncultured Clostridium sp.]